MELSELLERAQTMGIDPRRVLVALGIQRDAWPEPVPSAEPMPPRGDAEGNIK